MNKRLKIALIGCSSDKGFALPIAMGMGLIMILIAATMIMRSQGDQATASAQKATNQGLSAAETGITRYQSLINSNRVIAMYPRTGTPGWTTASAIPGIANTCTGNVNGASAVTTAATTDWQNIDSSDSSKGQYRLVDYSYQADPAPATSGIGTLTVEGRVNQVGSGNTASAGVGAATTRLQVNIRVAKQSSSGSIPGLWLNNVGQNMGSNKVDGNILVSGCTLPAGVLESNVKDQTTQDANASPNAIMPATPLLPPKNALGLDTFNRVSGTNSDVWGQTFPRKNALGVITDIQQPDGSYVYLIQGDLKNPSASNITIQSGAKVIFYVQGNIDIGGNTNINVSGDPSQMQIYGNTFLRNPNGTIMVDPIIGTLTGTPLTKYNCSVTLLPIPINPGLTDVSGACPTRQVKIGGSGSIKALVHAPDATGAVSGGGGDCSSTRGFVGAVWLNKWDTSLGSNTSNALVCATGDYGSFLATQNSAPPSIPSVTGWQRQEAQP